MICPIWRYRVAYKKKIRGKCHQGTPSSSWRGSFCSVSSWGSRPCPCNKQHSMALVGAYVLYPKIVVVDGSLHTPQTINTTYRCSHWFNQSSDGTKTHWQNSRLGSRMQTLYLTKIRDRRSSHLMRSFIPQPSLYRGGAITMSQSSKESTRS